MEGYIMKMRKYDEPMDKIYQAMLQRFRRAGHSNPGVLASFYLDVFVFKTKTVKADDVYDLNLAPQGTFTEIWREEQKKAGYLTWTTTAIGPRFRVDYKSGPKILKYINNASMLVDQVVTRSDFDLLSQRVDLLESALDVVIEIVDPPTSAEKRIHYSDPQNLRMTLKYRRSETVISELEAFNHPDYSSELKN